MAVLPVYWEELVVCTGGWWLRERHGRGRAESGEWRAEGE